MGSDTVRRMSTVSATNHSLRLLVCLNCGRVEEFFDAEIERRQRAVAHERGFSIQEHALALYAQCTKANCKYRPRPANPHEPLDDAEGPAAR